MNPLARSVLLAALLLSTAASASALIGTVTDAQNQPVAEVVVTVTSPALTDKQVVVTDAQGSYRVADLPPGVYTLRFEKQALETYVRTDLPLRANRTARLNAQLLPETTDEAVASTQTRQTVDIGTACMPVGQEVIKRIAVSRPRSSSRHQTPGIRVDSTRDLPPSWMLSRMPVLIPDGTPQLVYRAPSAQRGSPDFGR